MRNLKKIAMQLWNDESGQGTTEYILMLVIVVGVAMLFKDGLTGIISEKLGALKEIITGFGG